MHDLPLPQCDIMHKEFRQHQSESVSVRDSVAKSCQQILTLEKAHEATMRDISDIKDDVRSLLQMLNDIKIWILASAVATLLSLLAVAMYYGGDKKQNEINTKRIDRIEASFFGRHTDNANVAQ